MSRNAKNGSSSSIETPRWLIGNVKRLGALSPEDRLNEECELLYDWLQLDCKEINMRKAAERDVIESCKQALVDKDFRFIGSSVTTLYLPDSDINILFYSKNMDADFKKLMKQLKNDDVCEEFILEPTMERPSIRFLHRETGMEVTIEAQSNSLDISQAAFIQFSIKKFKYYKRLAILLKYLLKVNGFSECIEKERSFLFYLLIVYFLYQYYEKHPSSNASIGTLFAEFLSFYGKEVHILGISGYTLSQHNGALNVEGNYALQQFLLSIEEQLHVQFNLEQNSSYIMKYADFFSNMWERLIYRLKQSSGPILIEFFPIVPRITNAMRISDYYHVHFPPDSFTAPKKRYVRRHQYYDLNPCFLILSIVIIILLLIIFYFSIVTEDIYSDMNTY